MTGALRYAMLASGAVGLLVAGLGIHVSLTRIRRKNRRSDGGGDVELIRRIRAHGNAAEHVPLLLVLLGLVAAAGVPAGAVLGAGVAIGVARVLHATGVLAGRRALSIAGATITYVLEVGLAASLLLFATRGDP